MNSQPTDGCPMRFPVIRVRQERGDTIWQVARVIYSSETARLVVEQMDHELLRASGFVSPKRIWTCDGGIEDWLYGEMK